jgi:type I restriction enzyme S subunit
VPKVRFPEFRGAAGWENAILGDLSEVVRGGSPRPIDGFLTTSANGLNWLKIGDVDKEAKYVTHTAEKVRPEALSKTRVVNPGDLILSNSMSFGRPFILQIKTCIHDGWIAITDIAKKADRDFLYYSISAPSSQSYFVDNAAGSGVQNLNADIIKALPVCFPPPAEQQKIAECLSSVDELLAAQARKVDALKTYKKGLMQQLFPREGETQPRLRFPEFQNAGEWSKMTLGQAAAFYNGRAYKQEELLESGKYPVLRVGNFFTNNIWYHSDLELDETKYCENGDLLYAWSASFGPRVWHGKKSIYHYHIWKVVEQRGIDKQFLFITLENETENMKAKTTNGLGIMHITKGAIESWETSFPTITEQEKIADCLRRLDYAITGEIKKLDVLKIHKKSLMQQLFLSPDAIQS